MDNKEINHSNEVQSSSDTSAPHASTQQASRRKLITGLVATSAVLSLANRPAFAASCSISGFMSAKVGTSLTPYDEGLCDGWSPGNWKKNVGQITQEAWDTSGVARTTPFNNVFTTAMLEANYLIRKLVNGIPVPTPYSYTSPITTQFQPVLEGAVDGGNNHGSIVKHAAATFLNARFIANGGMGTAPDDWMINYVSPSDVIGLYLLYEITHRNTQPADCSFQLEKNGAVVATSQNMTTAEYNDFFVSLSNGSGSDTWQNG